MWTKDLQVQPEINKVRTDVHQLRNSGDHQCTPHIMGDSPIFRRWCLWSNNCQQHGRRHGTNCDGTYLYNRRRLKWHFSFSRQCFLRFENDRTCIDRWSLCCCAFPDACNRSLSGPGMRHWTDGWSRHRDRSLSRHALGLALVAWTIRKDTFTFSKRNKRLRLKSTSPTYLDRQIAAYLHAYMIYMCSHIL